MRMHRLPCIPVFAVLSLLLPSCGGEDASRAGYAIEVIEYRPAPGQFLDRAADPATVLGPPDRAVASLGGFGGSLTVRLAGPLAADATLVIWGNAFYMGGDPRKRWAEPATVELSADGTNWYLVGGSLVDATNPPRVLRRSVVRTNTNQSSWPAWAAGQETASFTAIDLGTAFLDRVDPAAGYAHVDDPGAAEETLYGYADCTPAGVLPAGGSWVPDDPLAFGIEGVGGDTVRPGWLVDDEGLPVGESVRNLAFRFVRLTCAVDASFPVLGEVSTEIDALGIAP